MPQAVVHGAGPSIAPCQTVCAIFAHTSSGFNSPSLNTLLIHGIVLHADIHLRLSVLRLIYDYLVVFVHSTLSFPFISLLKHLTLDLLSKSFHKVHIPFVQRYAITWLHFMTKIRYLQVNLMKKVKNGSILQLQNLKKSSIVSVPFHSKP